MMAEPQGGADPVVGDLETMSLAGRYQQWMFGQLAHALGQRIVECGAGIGNMTRLLTDRELVVAVDHHGPCVEALEKRFSAYPNVVPLLLDLGEPGVSALARYRPDTVVCINVMEHIEDDAGLLRRLHGILAPGGALALLVPAMPSLYGTIDRRLRHFRRYDKRRLAALMEATGFRVAELFFMNAVAPLGWFINGRVLKRSTQAPRQVLVFDRLIVPWLSRLERIIRPPFGLSLIAIAYRDPSPQSSVHGPSSAEVHG
ncbi:MAG TPA: class I SAM-dependent methyltransferase [bacterium]